VFGFSSPLTAKKPSAVFTIGHVREPYVVRRFLSFALGRPAHLFDP
jgi:hypothetical protein